MTTGAASASDGARVATESHCFHHRKGRSEEACCGATVRWERTGACGGALAVDRDAAKDERATYHYRT